MTGYVFLIQHYNSQFSKLIFKTRKVSDIIESAIMYSYNYKNELENFKKNFGYYLVFFIKTHDYLNNPQINFQLNTNEILSRISKKIWTGTNGNFKKRSTNVDGIYGELFLDFYIRIIKGYDLFLTYSSRKSFNSKFEVTGYDNFGYIINNDNIEIVIAESKFVNSLSNAKKALMTDITGSDSSTSHFTVDYFNEFSNFVLERYSFTYKDNAKKITNFLHKINRILYNEEKTFLDIIKTENIKLNFIFFAIYNDKRKEPSLIEEVYNDLITTAQNQISNMGIVHYSIEVVFIPTDNKSIIIKEEINNFYA